MNVGVDMVLVSRFAEKQMFSNTDALHKIFTPQELAYCLSCTHPAQHLAARFAAKEAVIKALAAAGEEMHIMKDCTKIEVIRSAKGVPSIVLHDLDLQKWNVKISLSHTEEQAIAFAIVFK